MSAERVVVNVRHAARTIPTLPPSFTGSFTRPAAGQSANLAISILSQSGKSFSASVAFDFLTVPVVGSITTSRQLSFKGSSIISSTGAKATLAGRGSLSADGQTLAGSYWLRITHQRTTSHRFTTTRSSAGATDQKPASILITPPASLLAGGPAEQLVASLLNAAGQPLAVQPSFAFSLSPGGAGGTINTSGLYTPPATGSGNETVLATAEGLIGKVTFAIGAAASSPLGVFSSRVDVGSPSLAGQASYANGSYLVMGSGTDIWNTSDQFDFVSTPLTGNGVIVARVASMQNTNPTAKAGVMFRQTLDGTSSDAYVTLAPTNKVQFLDRSANGAAATDVGDAMTPGGPLWVKLVRQENSFSGFWSADGNGWNQLGSAITLSQSASLSVGLVVSSHDTSLLNASTFDHVTLNSMPTSGVYRIAPRIRPDLSLDVEGFANADETPVSLYTANHTSNQQWLVQGQGDGSYKIFAYSGANSLQMLDDTGANTASGTPVNTYEDNGNNAQRWIFLPTDASGWRIVPFNAAGTAQTLEIQGGAGATLGSRAQIGTFSGASAQVFQLDDPGPAALYLNAKKGLAGWPQESDAIHNSWVYTWGGDRPANLPAGVEFVPMSWGYYGNANNSFVNFINSTKTQPGVKEMLGYNEPDSSSQANLSVASALDGWQYLAAAGLPVGSPAAVHADDQWMQDFMAGAAQRGYRVDFVTIHWYGGDDPAGFLNYVDYIHNLYNKPVWITEFAPADWSGNHGISAQQAADFMRQVVPQLNQRWYVDRYSWFSANTGDAALGQSALFNGDGSLTALGQLYSRM